jgi:hypothetical protein
MNASFLGFWGDLSLTTFFDLVHVFGSSPYETVLYLERRRYMLWLAGEELEDEQSARLLVEMS